MICFISIVYTISLYVYGVTILKIFKIILIPISLLFPENKERNSQFPEFINNSPWAKTSVKKYRLHRKLPCNKFHCFIYVILDVTTNWNNNSIKYVFRCNVTCYWNSKILVVMLRPFCYTTIVKIHFILRLWNITIKSLLCRVKREKKPAGSAKYFK